MEKKIIDIMRSNGLDKVHLDYLVDLGDWCDADGDILPLVGNTIVIEDDSVIIYDDNNEIYGHVDSEDKYRFAELEEQQQEEAFFWLNATLGHTDAKE